MLHYKYNKKNCWNKIEYLVLILIIVYDIYVFFYRSSKLSDVWHG